MSAGKLACPAPRCREQSDTMALPRREPRLGAGPPEKPVHDTLGAMTPVHGPSAHHQPNQGA